MTYDTSVLFVGAHPDDEGGASGALAKYAAQGGRSYVVCVTRGDGVDAKIFDPGVARERLGEARVGELRCACEKLGINPPIVLGYQDGEVEKVAPLKAARTVARLLRQLRPAVVLTHGPEGGYGHPDHIAVSHFVTQAVALAGDPSADLEAPLFAPAKLYYTAIPQSFSQSVPAFRDRRADIGGQQLGFRGVPDEQITTVVDIKDWLKVKVEALTCHRTQFEFDESGQPKLFSSGMPEEDRLRLFGSERYVLVGAQAGLKEGDLFAGIDLRPTA